MSKRFMYIFLIGFGILFVQTIPTIACSGGPLPWDELLPRIVENSEVIVIGQYVELDDAEANGIFHVETYFKGTGSEFIIIQASDLPAIENSKNVHRVYPCGVGSPSSLQSSGEYLYYLKQQLDGSYNIRYTQFFSDKHRPIRVSYGYSDIREITLYDITIAITQLVGAEPTEPNLQSLYPRVAPILLTTRDNRHYLLPVDSNDLIEISPDEVGDLTRKQYQCDVPPCTVFSPNGMDKVTLVADADHPSSDAQYPVIVSTIAGQRIIFSPTSDTFALWNDDQIEVYALWYPAYGFPDDWISHGFSLEVVNTMVVSNSLEFPVAWHPDGRLLVFSTDKGLWLWDALMVDSKPQLLIPTVDNVPLVRYFSPKGRYIAVTEGNHSYNFDLISRQQLPDGYVSPDDRTLLVFDTQAETPTTLDVMYLAPGIRSFEFYSKVNYLDVQWINDTYFIASVTGFTYLDYEFGEPNFDENGEIISYEAIPFVVEETFYDVLVYHSSGAYTLGYGRDKEVPYSIQDTQTNAFTYDSILGLIEISVDGYFLIINGQQIWYDSPLDVPIVNATWLPLLYFEECHYRLCNRY